MKKNKSIQQYNIPLIALIVLMFLTGSLYYTKGIKVEEERKTETARNLMDKYIDETARDLSKNSRRYYEYGIIDRSEFDYMIRKRSGKWELYRSSEKRWESFKQGDIGKRFSEDSQGIVFFDEKYYVYGGVGISSKPVFSLWEMNQNFFDIFSSKTGVEINRYGDNPGYLFQGGGSDKTLEVYFDTGKTPLLRSSRVGIFLGLIAILIGTFIHMSRKKIETLESRISEVIELIQGSRGERPVEIEGSVINPEVKICLEELRENYCNKSKEVYKLKGRLVRTNLELRELAIMDKLTGVYNKMFLYEILNELKKDKTTPPYHNIIMMIDLDNFKKLNDTSGHLAGDSLLQELGMLLKGVGSRWGTAFRYGGDEFLMIFKNIKYEEFLEVIWEFETRKKDIIGKYLHVRLGVSAGAMVIEDEGDMEPEALVKKVDNLLYKAKKNGKNQLMLKI